MRFKKNMFIFILCVLCFSPVLVSAKIGNYGILNEINNSDKSENVVDNSTISDIDKTSNSVVNAWGTNKSVEVLIMLSLIFGGFVVTSGVLYKLVIKKNV